MAQQNYLFSPSCYGQGPGTNYSYNDVSHFQEDSARIGSAAMDRGQGLSNNSIRTDHSDSTWSEISWNTSLTGASPMSTMSTWEEVTSMHIKGEESPYEWQQNAETMEYSAAASQDYQTPITQSASFTEPTIESRHTPTSLGWSPHTRLLEIYKFVVRKGGKDPYFQLMDGFEVRAETPSRVFLDYPKSPKKGDHPCQYPWGCSGKQTVFTRPADLERHYKNVHASSDQKDSFRCDYAKCGRSHEPFTRKDHYRDHLRDYHKEDLGCAKAQKRLGTRQWAAEQATWLAERKVSSRWWRCARCLLRRQVQSDGWDCPACKVTCDQDRIEIRMNQAQRQKSTVLDPSEAGRLDYQTTSSVATITAASGSDASGIYECGTCQDYPGWTDNGMGQWVACPTCTPRQAEASYSAEGYYT